MNITEKMFLLTQCLGDYQPDRMREQNEGKCIYAYFWVQKSCSFYHIYIYKKKEKNKKKNTIVFTLVIYEQVSPLTTQQFYSYPNQD